MITSLIVVSLLSTGPCTLSGRVELTRAGKKLDPSGRVALYVETVPAQAFEAVNQTHSVLQVGLQFKPKVLVVLKGDSIQFKNDDKDEHGVFSNETVPTFKRERSRQGLTGSPVPFKFSGAARIQCDIHEWMRLDVLVVDNPFFTMANADGSWKISGLPAGRYTVVAWEPNGNVKRYDTVKKCASEISVVLPLEQKAERKLRNLNNHKYPPYPPGLRPVVATD